MNLDGLCPECGSPLEQPTTGRRRRYCSRQCQRRARRREQREEAYVEAVARVVAASERLQAMQAMRAALDVPHVAHDDPLDQHEFRSFEGSEWLASRRGAFAPGLDTEAAADAIRQRFEGEQRA